MHKYEMQHLVTRLAKRAQSGVICSVEPVTDSTIEKDKEGDPLHVLVGYRIVLSAPYTRAVEIPLGVTADALEEIAEHALDSFTVPS